MAFVKIDIKDKVSSTANVYTFVIDEENKKITLTPDESGTTIQPTIINASILQRYEDYLDLLFGTELDDSKNYKFRCVCGKYGFIEIIDENKKGECIYGSICKENNRR